MTPLQILYWQIYNFSETSCIYYAQILRHWWTPCA